MKSLHPCKEACIPVVAIFTDPSYQPTNERGNIMKYTHTPGTSETVVWQGSEDACWRHADTRGKRKGDLIVVRPCLPADLTDADSVEDARNMWEVAIISRPSELSVATDRIAQLTAEVAELRAIVDGHERHLL